MTAAYWIAAAVGHVALWVEVVNRSHGLIPHRVLSKSVTAICGLIMIGVGGYAATRWPIASTADGGGWLATYSNICVVFAIVWATMRLALRFDPLRHAAPTETRVVDFAERLGDAATGSPTIARVANVAGNPLLRLHVEHRTIQFERLPESLIGLRVAHLTDLHMSDRLGPDYFREVVRLTNEAEPDLVCLTGDIVEHTPQLDWIESALADLAPRVAAYFVLGNHDANVDEGDLRRRLEAIGLVDASRARIDHGPELGGMTVVGDERPWRSAWSDPAGDEPFSIALVHTPDRFGWAARRGIDFVLAGHNHGGQVCFPGLGPLLCPSRHGVRYASGTFRRGRTVMHVGRGTGSLFPLRFRCPPELGVFTLTRPDQA